MPKEIFNEGRVAGLSSYSEYVRQLKSVDPDFDVCTEREWLSASLGTGSSMVLKIPKGAGDAVGDNMYMYQVEAPDGSHIGAGSSVYASYFYGDCEFDSKGWATVVKDYGTLICNTSAKHPDGAVSNINSSTIPVGDISQELSLPTTADMSSISYKTQHKRLSEYIKIVDGLVLQPGTWSRSEASAPYMDFVPDLHLNPVIRFTFMEPITNDFYVLITGFTNRSILRGSSKFDFKATETENKQDGDFLGCEAYPWACKVQFLSSPAVDYMMKSSLKSGSRNVKVETYADKPLIKITSNNLLDATVYSRRSSTDTDKSGKDNFGNSTTVWKGTSDASHWYNSTRDANVVCKGNDPSRTSSGQETLTTHDLSNPYQASTKLGFKVDNKYSADDSNIIKNGQHGGWYNVEIDPYQLIKDLIDEVFARFNYVDQRLSEIELEIKNEMNHRREGDKYVINKIYSGEGGMDTLVSILNELLKTIYNPGNDLGLKVSYTDVKLDDDYDDGTSVGTLRKPTVSWAVDKNGIAIKPNANDGKIPRAKLNIYSGDGTGASATDFMRSRSDNSENDIWSK